MVKPFFRSYKVKKIKVLKWKEGEVEVDTLKALIVLMNMKDPQKMPKGLDKFRLYSRIDKAFKEAETTGTIELEEIDYAFLKKTIEEEVPSTWGFNKDITKVIEEFLEAK